jgi:hypothetical protein
MATTCSSSKKSLASLLKRAENVRQSIEIHLSTLDKDYAGQWVPGEEAGLRHGFGKLLAAMATETVVLSKVSKRTWTSQLF